MTVRLIGEDASGSTKCDQNYIHYARFIALETGIVSEIRINSGASGHAKVAIYSDSSGEPGNKITGNDSSQAVTGGQWNTLTIANTNITKGTYYWLGLIVDTYGTELHAYPGGTTKYKAATFSTFTWPAGAGGGLSSYPLLMSTTGYGVLPQSYIYPTGIASQEAFGSPTVLPGAVIIQPSAIQSAEALGSPQLNLKLFAQSIPTAEAFGTVLVILGAVIIQPSGIASLEAFGTPNLLYDQVIIPTGIASQEAFGSPTVILVMNYIYPTGIPSAEAFGTPHLLYDQVIIPTAIASQEAFGSPTVLPGAVIIQPSGIASQEAFGTAKLNLKLFPSAIASLEAFGTPNLLYDQVIIPTAIASQEAFGALKVLREIIHIILDGQYTRGSPGVNRIYIIGKDSEGNPVYGTSLNQAEIDLVGERLDFTQDLSIPTTAKAADVAAAAVAKARLTGSRGFIVIPPNCGQELWDVVQVTDKPTAQSQQKYRIIAVSFDYEPLRHRFQHKLILGAP